MRGLHDDELRHVCLGHVLCVCCGVLSVCGRVSFVHGSDVSGERVPGSRRLHGSGERVHDVPCVEWCGVVCDVHGLR